MRRIPAHLARRIVLSLIWIYRNGVSPLFPPSCRFVPSCSCYAGEAVARYGVLRGGWLTVRRLLRCHPFYRGPVLDPVPESRQDPETCPRAVAGTGRRHSGKPTAPLQSDGATRRVTANG